MAKFISDSMEALNQQFPDEGTATKRKVARQHWLESEERAECIKLMSSAERKRRRFEV